MGMYDERLPIDEERDTTDLHQGDILAGIFMPDALTGASYNVHKGNSYGQASATDISDAEKAGGQKLKLITSVKRRPFCLVVSSTCDNFQGTSPVLLVPIEPYEFDEEDDSDPKKWMRISADATGTGSAKLFYLAGHLSAGLSRSHAVLNRITHLSHKYLARCFKELDGRRLCGLTPAAQRHLQYTLSLMFSRNAREDNEWPSVEDLTLKASWLRESLKVPGRQRERYEADLREVEQLLATLAPPPERAEEHAHENAVPMSVDPPIPPDK